MANKAVTTGIGTAAGAGIGALLGNPMIGATLGGTLGGMFGGGGDPQQAALTQVANPQQLANADQLSQSGLDQQQAFVNALQAQNGIGNQNQVYGQLQGIANGTGANPAQAMLAQATGANVAQQAALMAGQRGAGANAGLIARQAALQGGNIQQQAAGQGATMQANQSLNAIGAAGNLANQQVGQQANALGNYNQFAQNKQGQLLGAAQGYNNALSGNQQNVNNNNQTVAGRDQTQAGGLLNGVGGAAGLFGGAAKPTGQGTEDFLNNPSNTSSGFQMPVMGASQAAGVAPHLAEGGPVGPSSFVGRHLSGNPQFAGGGKVDALVSKGEVIVPPGKVNSKDPIKAGKKVPGKPEFKGNDYRNDVVPKKLEKGGIVIPNEIMQGKDPHGNAAAFVAAILSKQGLKK